MKDDIDFEKRAEAINVFVAKVLPMLDEMCESCLAAGSTADQVKFTAACILTGVTAYMGDVSIEDAVNMSGRIIADAIETCVEQEQAS